MLHELFDTNNYESNKGSKTGILLIHGFTNTTYELKKLFDYLTEQKYHVILDNLPGHGTSVRDCNSTTYYEWIDHVEKRMAYLSSHCDNLYVCGISMGALLAMHISVTFPINGLISAAPVLEFNKPYLIGAHISEGTNLPSGEKISEIIKNINHEKLLGIILSCISPENYQLNLNEIKNLGVPFGFKLNAFVKTNPKPNYTGAFNQSKTGNPNEFLGVREDLTPEKMLEFAREFKNAGATILGGCCETRPSHIKAFAQLK